MQDITSTMKHVHDSISMKGLIIGIPFGLLMGFMFDNATLGLLFGVAFGITLNLTVFETKKKR